MAIDQWIGGHLVNTDLNKWISNLYPHEKKALTDVLDRYVATLNGQPSKEQLYKKVDEVKRVWELEKAGYLAKQQSKAQLEWIKPEPKNKMTNEQHDRIVEELKQIEKDIDVKVTLEHKALEPMFSETYEEENELSGFWQHLPGLIILVTTIVVGLIIGG